MHLHKEDLVSIWWVSLSQTHFLVSEGNVVVPIKNWETLKIWAPSFYFWAEKWLNLQQQFGTECVVFTERGFSGRLTIAKSARLGKILERNLS